MASELEVGKIMAGDGTTTALAGADDVIIAQSSGDAGVTIRTATSSTGQICFADGNTGNEAYRGFIGYAHGTDKLNLGSGGDTRLTINSSGQTTLTSSNQNVLFVNRTTSNGEAIVVEAAGTDRVRIGTEGITFPNGGTAPAIAAANQLDYYEQGTFTLTDASGAGLTLTGGAGKYTRIGDRVFITVQFSMPTTSDGSNMKLSGLPFAVPDDDDSRGLVLNYSNKTDVEYALTLKATDDIEFFTDTGAYSTCTNGSGGGFYINGHYKV